ncbi:HutD-family protein [Rhizobium sp. R72]|uniref:HutD/Ves family protein n=1 Tax=unclassified Rhizobium TaxID=2613769 RepID=UPI000B533CDB|nr:MULTISPECIES: HutD family protein [unclassified Rhizobium]OWW04575.1 HutD-family protein [Rhizobium sp. R72]OWW05632.1 HutD-family protein [Rhizobium sp. R711]
MIRATVLRSSTYRRMPWKNGCGETVEIAISPEGATLSDFGWRLSMATVATDGPFSIFAGIDRTLSILDGNGMSLTIDGEAPVLLTQDSAPLAFPADVSVSATLPDGPIMDLNVMTRRKGFLNRVDRVDVDSRVTVHPAAPTWFLLCHWGTLTVDCSGEHTDLGPKDALLLEQAKGTDVVVSGKARCFLISIDPI